MPRIVEDFTLNWRIGLRTAALINRTAGRFESKVSLAHNAFRVDAKSRTGVLTLGPYRPRLLDGSWHFGPDAGARVRVIVEGPDAAEAYLELKELFTCGSRVVSCRNTDCYSTAILTDYDRDTVEYSCSNFHAWTFERRR